MSLNLHLVSANSRQAGEQNSGDVADDARDDDQKRWRQQLQQHSGR